MLFVASRLSHDYENKTSSSSGLGRKRFQYCAATRLFSELGHLTANTMLSRLMKVSSPSARLLRPFASSASVLQRANVQGPSTHLDEELKNVSGW